MEENNTRLEQREEILEEERESAGGNSKQIM